MIILLACAPPSSIVGERDGSKAVYSSHARTLRDLLPQRLGMEDKNSICLSLETDTDLLLLYIVVRAITVFIHTQEDEVVQLLSE